VEGIQTGKSLTAHYHKRLAGRADIHRQFSSVFLLATGDGATMAKSLVAHYFKLSADQGNARPQSGSSKQRDSPVNRPLDHSPSSSNCRYQILARPFHR
jgi:hypothetical protein